MSDAHHISTLHTARVKPLVAWNDAIHHATPHEFVAITRLTSTSASAPAEYNQRHSTRCFRQQTAVRYVVRVHDSVPSLNVLAIMDDAHCATTQHRFAFHAGVRVAVFHAGQKHTGFTCFAAATKYSLRGSHLDPSVICIDAVVLAAI